MLVSNCWVRAESLCCRLSAHEVLWKWRWEKQLNAIAIISTEITEKHRLIQPLQRCLNEKPAWFGFISIFDCLWIWWLGTGIGLLSLGSTGRVDYLWSPWKNLACASTWKCAERYNATISFPGVADRPNIRAWIDKCRQRRSILQLWSDCALVMRQSNPRP